MKEYDGFMILLFNLDFWSSKNWHKDHQCNYLRNILKY